jgi:uncharacterized phiE125 gp8 family phage protein
MTFCSATTWQDYYPDRTVQSRNQGSVRHTLRVVTPPTSEPVTIAEAKMQLHIGASDDAHDTELAAFIAAAREEWERDTSAALINRTIEHRLPRFESIVSFTVLPVVSIESVTYIDSNGDEQTVDDSQYYLDVDQLRFVNGFSKPAIADRSEAVRIQYVAGYGNDSKFCPELDRMAIKLNLAYRFENRDMMVSDTAFKTTAYESLVHKKMRSSYP